MNWTGVQVIQFRASLCVYADLCVFARTCFLLRLFRTKTQTSAKRQSSVKRLDAHYLGGARAREKGVNR